jgi:hypothetical protein
MAKRANRRPAITLCSARSAPANLGMLKEAVNLAFGGSALPTGEQSVLSRREVFVGHLHSGAAAEVISP